MTEEENLALRKRLFEILNKYCHFKPLNKIERKRVNNTLNVFKNSTDNKRIHTVLHALTKSQKESIYVEDLEEIIRILAFVNPYSEQQMVREVEFENLKEYSGLFTTDRTKISIDIFFLFSVLNKKISIFELFNTLGHEQRHNLQHNYELGHDSSLLDKYFAEIKEAFYRSYLTSTDIIEADSFVKSQRVLGHSSTRTTSKKIETYQFGAYLNEAHECDARAFGHQFATEMYLFITEDELCSPELKEFLTKEFYKYLKFYKEIEDSNQIFRKKYKNLNKELKKIFTKIISGKKIRGVSPEVALAILDKHLSRLTDEMTLDERVDFYGFAIDNDFNNLLDKINFTKNVPQEQNIETSQYLQTLLTSTNITSEQVLPIANSISELTPNSKSPALQICVKDLIKNHRFAFVYQIISVLEQSLRCLNLGEILIDITNYINTMIANIKQESQDAKVCILSELFNLVAFLSVNLSLIECDEEIKNNFLMASANLSSLEYNATFYYTEKDFEKDYRKIYGKKEFKKYFGHDYERFEGEQLDLF